MITSLMALMLSMAAQETQLMRVRPTTEAQAVREFEETCVAGFRDSARLNQAIAASKRGYTQQAAAESGRHSWVSPFGSLHYFDETMADERRVPACNFTAFTRDTVNRRILAEEVAAMARRNAVDSLIESRDEDRVSWSWIDAEKRPVTVMVVVDRKTPQQIILSLRPLPLASS